MQDVNVVSCFYSRTGKTEKLALAAALGAVNGRANIRLRRLPELALQAEILTLPAWKETCERFDQEYVAPREADALWAEAIIIATPAGFGAASPELHALEEWLAPLGAKGKLEGKIGLALTSGADLKQNEAVLGSLNGLLVRIGLIAVPFGHSLGSPDDVQAAGKRLANIARAMKPLVKSQAGPVT